MTNTLSMPSTETGMKRAGEVITLSSYARVRDHQLILEADERWDLHFPSSGPRAGRPRPGRGRNH